MVLALVVLILSAEPPLPSGVPEPVKGSNPYLSQAKELYQNLDFEKCLKRLSQAPQWKSDSAELIEIELVAGMCHYNLNQRVDAEERFRLALRMNPDAELPEYTSPKLVDFFLAVKRKLRAPPPPMPKEDLDMPREVPAPKETVTAPPDEPRAEVTPKLTPDPKPPPPGIPEVERPSAMRRRTVPIVLTVLTAVAVGVGIGLGATAKSLEQRANTAKYDADFYKLGDSARANAMGANVSFGVGAAAGLGAIVGWVVTSD